MSRHKHIYCYIAHLVGCTMIDTSASEIIFNSVKSNVIPTNLNLTGHHGNKMLFRLINNVLFGKLICIKRS